MRFNTSPSVHASRKSPPNSSGREAGAGTPLFSDGSLGAGRYIAHPPRATGSASPNLPQPQGERLRRDLGPALSAAKDGAKQGASEQSAVAAAAAQFIGLRIALDLDHAEQVALLTKGLAQIGRGMTGRLLQGRYEPGKLLKGEPRADLGGAFGPSVVTDDQLRGHDSYTLATNAWRSELGRYAQMAQIGCVLLAGTAARFASWVRAEKNRQVVMDVPEGRLFALIDGHIVALSIQANTAAWTVETGSGSLVWSDGSYYVGELHNDMKEGRGTYQYACGDTYLGEYRNDQRHGQGVSTFTDGSSYMGLYQNDKANGEGVFSFASGNEYVGEFLNDLKHGTGTFTFASGARYEGQWVSDVRCGTGVYTWPDGDTYVGEYYNDKMHGHGVYTYGSGAQQKIGQFREGKYVGPEPEDA